MDDVALEFKEAADRAKQNREECRQIEKRVARAVAMSEWLDKSERARKAVIDSDLKDLQETLALALKLVTSCEEEKKVTCLRSSSSEAGNLSKQLRQVNIKIKESTARLVNNVHNNIVFGTGKFQDESTPAHQRSGLQDMETHDRREGENISSLFSEAGLTAISIHGVRDITDHFSESQQIAPDTFKANLFGAEVVVKAFETLQAAFYFARILSVLGRHENIARFMMFCYPKKTTEYVVGMHYQGGSLEGVINGESSWQARYELIRGIAEGIAHMHRKNIIHSNLTPDTILLDSNMTPKISGLEISKILDEEDAETRADDFMGRKNYMAPEYVRRRAISLKNDVYSFGVLLLCIVTKNRYLEDPRIGTRQLDEHVAEILGLCSGFSESDENKIKACIEIGLTCTEEKPQHRLSMPDVLKMLDHNGIVRTVKRDEMELHFDIKTEESKYVDPSSPVSEFAYEWSGVHGEQSNPECVFTYGQLAEATHYFSKKNFIGESDIAIVYKGKLLDGTVVTIKIFHEQWQLTSIQRYKECFKRSFQHKNIVRVLGYCEEPRQKLSMVVEEYSRTLSEIINGQKDIDWPSRFQIIRGVAKALGYLHSKNIIHFNLTPANIAIFDTEYHMIPKICDFGFSKIIDDEDLKKHRVDGGVCEKEAKEFEITAGSTAPEYLDGVISVKNDIYNFGDLVCSLSGMSRFGPPKDFNDLAMAVRVARRTKNLFDPSSCERIQLKQIKDCMYIGRKCTQMERARRPTIDEVLGILNKAKNRER